MKKVGLVSVRNYNYGSILQAYAFQYVLKKNRINNEIIFYQKTNSIQQVKRVFNVPLLKSKIKIVFRKVQEKTDREVGYFMQKRNESFSAFVNHNLEFSKIYVGRRELENCVNNYCAFVLGSDQVWNPMNLGSDFYTLTFVPDDNLKVTYASSFGVSNIPKIQLHKTISYLSRINEISVREKSGQKIIKKLTGRDVPVVVDPTMLLNRDDWNKLFEDEVIETRPYIFVYFVGASIEHRKMVSQLQQETGYEVIGIPFVDEYVKADKMFCNKKFAGIGPKEFVNLIRHAKYVCTDSFHATVFSIQYQKLFFVFDRYSSNSKSSMNGRLSSLLSTLGLEKRLVVKRGNIIGWFGEDIDYSNVEKKICVFRKESEQYLKKIILQLKEKQDE